ncbi:hypothetical protein AWB82_05923 [Caballeronia glebae]|uniref:Lipoprotein n=2 Tax=Caballeronia glebae TaxID=1777143 RepID=A0A158CWW5_9BURK|nr:hypothetical protein AWB82_05923 [Caballeronia glebae]
MNSYFSHIARGIVAFSSAALVAPSGGWAQSVPKKGLVDATYTAAGTGVKEIVVSGDDVVYLTEFNLLMGNNSKTPLMQNVSAHCLESGFSAQAGSGYCVYTDKDGDKFVEAYNYARGSSSGKATLSSGTGKYKGIEGQFDWQQVQVLPAEKGAYNYIGKKTGNYRIP